MRKIFIEESEKTTALTTIKIKSAKLTNLYSAYLRQCGYGTSLRREEDGYAITIYGLNSEKAHKVVSKLIKKFRLVKTNTQTQLVA